MRLIDADALKDVIGIPKRLGNKAISYYIDTMPTIDAEPVRHGKWIYKEYIGCPDCGWLYNYYDGLEKEWNFCPHCGAKMEEVEE